MKKNKLIRTIVIVANFLFSFLWERISLLWNRASEVDFSIPLTDSISKETEILLEYCFSKAIALCIIVLFWKVIFAIADKKVRKGIVILFGAILAVVLADALIEWPDVFMWGGDNYITFGYALRMVPEYWHSFFLTCFYTACMMVIPHPVAITFIQCCLMVFALGYLFYRFDNSERLQNKGPIKYLIPVMALLPDFFYSATTPQRTETYSVMCIIYVAVILADIVDRKERKISELVLLALFGAFIGVFRTEGMIITFPLFVIYAVSVYQKKLVKIVIPIVAFGVLYVALNVPQKIGAIKYYGDDYSIINSFPFVRNVINSENANLDYEEAKEDLSAISKITPLDYIGEYGDMSYRYYNDEQGRNDINQSMASKEDAEAFLAAYKRMILHNPVLYAKTQWGMFMHAFKLTEYDYVVPYSGSLKGEKTLNRAMWEPGTYDLLNTRFVYTWTNLGIRNKAAVALSTFRNGFTNWLKKVFVYQALLIVEVLINLTIVIVEFVRLLKKKRTRTSLGLAALFMFGYMLAVALVMPAGHNQYFHAYYYATYVTIVIYLSVALSEKKGKELV